MLVICLIENASFHLSLNWQLQTASNSRPRMFVHWREGLTGACVLSPQALTTFLLVCAVSPSWSQWWAESEVGMRWVRGAFWLILSRSPSVIQPALRNSKLACFCWIILSNIAWASEFVWPRFFFFLSGLDLDPFTWTNHGVKSAPLGGGRPSVALGHRIYYHVRIESSFIPDPPEPFFFFPPSILQ